MTVALIRNKDQHGSTRRSADAWPIGAVRYLVAAIFTGFFLLPFYVIVTTALKTETAIFAWPPVWVFKPTLQSFYNALFVFGGRGADQYRQNAGRQKNALGPSTHDCHLRLPVAPLHGQLEPLK